MKSISKRALQTFKKWGERGGRKRAQSLSAAKRQAIARHAAQMRWGQKGGNKTIMPSVRLEEPLWQNPVYLEEVLDFGGISEWRELHDLIADRPFGAEAMALEKVLSATKIYGTTSLWKGILKRWQGNCS